MRTLARRICLMPICSKTEATLRPRRERNLHRRRERKPCPRQSILRSREPSRQRYRGRRRRDRGRQDRPLDGLGATRPGEDRHALSGRRRGAQRQGVAGGASSLRRAEAHNRPRAKAFADHCIRQHMLEASGGAAPAEADKAGRVRRRGVSQGSSPSDLENPAAAYML